MLISYTALTRISLNVNDEKMSIWINLCIVVHVTNKNMNLKWPSYAQISTLHPFPKVFYFHEKEFPPSVGRFQEKVEFKGDIFSSDASILVRDVMFSYNGTFSCQVKNPPDVHGNVGEVQLQVVTSGEMLIILVLINHPVLMSSS